MLDDQTMQDEVLQVLEKLLRRHKAPEPAPAPKHRDARQHSPERELALGGVLAALRRASHVRLNDGDQRQNECARDYILREIQAERALAHRSRAMAGDREDVA